MNTLSNLKLQFEFEFEIQLNKGKLQPELKYELALDEVVFEFESR
ncbi:hypothetical protein AWZ03_013863, partial [Drosophila navojoa]